MKLELVIAGAALAISIFGVIAPWYSEGQARLVLRYERYPSLQFPERERMRDAHFVIENLGPGDAYNVELIIFSQGENISQLLEGRTFEWIPPGHSVYVPFFQPFGTSPDAGAVLYSHGRFATNPAALRQRGKPNNLVEVFDKLPRWRKQIHRNRRMGIETPVTPHELR